MGDEMNTGFSENGATVTPDGKHLFFKEGTSDQTQPLALNRESPRLFT